MDFKAVEQAIQKGKLTEARRLLRAVTRLETLPVEKLLSYFRYARRVGDFHQASLKLEKFDNAFTELENEKAYFLGELGAFRQAIVLLEKSQKPLQNLDQNIEKQMHLGHFASLHHDYDKAIQAYDRMALLAGKDRPVQQRIGRLNEIGHRIYANENLKEQVQRLEDFRLSSLQGFPLLEQGAFYFLSLAFMGLSHNKEAREQLDKAFSLGTKHRLRESLLLTLTDFELNLNKVSKSSISRLKKTILHQNHIVYFDQFNKIMGKLYLERNEHAKAQKHFLKVIYGGRPSFHLREVLSLRDQQIIPQQCWMLSGDQAEILTWHQFIYNRIEKSRPPFFRHKKLQFSLNDVSLGLRQLTEKLSENFEFAIRDAELWQTIDGESYLYSYSVDRLKSLLARWRKSELANYAEITYKGHRLCLRKKSGVELYIIRQSK